MTGLIKLETVSQPPKRQISVAILPFPTEQLKTGRIRTITNKSQTSPSNRTNTRLPTEKLTSCEKKEASTGSKKLNKFKGARTRLTKANRCKPSRSPKQLAESSNTGSPNANNRMLTNVSAPNSGANAVSTCTSFGASTQSKPHQKTPKRITTGKVFRQSTVISRKSAPWPCILATVWVSARPNPRSNKLEKPMRPSAREKIPSRPAPRFSNSTGTESTPTMAGSTTPKTLMSAFFLT